MCGLVGVIGGSLASNHFEAFKWMLMFDTTRGEDSTGVAFRKVSHKTKKGEVTVLKAEGLPSNLYRKFPEVFSSKGVFKNTTITETSVNWLMGHNRAATVGLVNSLNAHPFHHGGITGCHNGTVRSGLTQLLSGPELKGSTDSEKIFYNLSKGKTLQEIVDVITGGTALTWWDSKKQSFNIYRNKDRPMHIVQDLVNNTIYYASEAWILKLALAKINLGHLKDKIEELPEDTHLEIPLEQGRIVKTVSKVIKPKVVATVTTSRVITMPSKKNNPPAWLNEKGNSGTSFQPYTGWLSVTNLSKEAFNYQARFGCSLCQTTLDFSDYLGGDVKWMDKETPFCSQCAKEFSVA